MSQLMATSSSSPPDRGMDIRQDTQLSLTTTRVPVCYFCGYPWCCSVSNTTAPSLVERDVCAQTTHTPLENMFQREATAVDLNKLPNFDAFLTPNEGRVLDVRSHLSTDRGLIVSTGTERSFFDLALSGPECEGLVVRDFNPLVKAYVDFNTLLLRIVRDGDMQHYVELSTSPQKLEEIRKLTEDASMPPHMKEYYLTHLDAFAKIYFGEIKNPNYWRNRSNLNFIKYYEDPILFNRLQRYAKSGNIIATVGDMGDLRFLDQKILATIDISNILDYTVLYIQTRSQPRIVTTKVGGGQTIYASSMYHSMTEQQINELEKLLGIWRQHILQSVTCRSGFYLHRLLRGGNRELLEVNSCFYSENLLDTLKSHKNRYWICIRDRWVDFSPRGNYRDWAMSLRVSDVQSFSLEECRVLEPFLPILFQELCTPREIRRAFSEIPARILGGPGSKTEDALSIYLRLTEQQIDELEELLGECGQILQEKRGTDEFERGVYLLLDNPELQTVHMYSESLLNALREHKHQYWIKISNEWVDFSREGNWGEWAMNLKESDIQNFSLKECQALERFLPNLLEEENLQYLSHEVVSALSAIPARLAEGRNHV